MSEPSADDLAGLLPSWQLHLHAANRSPKTIKGYLESAQQLIDWLRDEGQAQVPIGRRQLEGFVAHLLQTRSASTAATRYRCLQQLYRWLVEEGEVATSPMAGMRPPRMEEKPVPVIDDDDLRALLRACDGKAFEERRDAALLRVFIDTGARLAEVAGMQLEDVDRSTPGQWLLHVIGKGRKHRVLPLGAKAAQALDRYLRVRQRHPLAGLDALWLGQRGPLSDSGIAQMLRRRCAQAGIAAVHPHQLRHTFAHAWLASGGGERDLMQLAGWSSPQMLARYGSSLAAQRARDAHRRLTPGDRL